MRCKDCSKVRGYPYKRGHLVALRADQDFGERSAVNVVAGGAIAAHQFSTADLELHHARNRAASTRSEETMPPDTNKKTLHATAHSL